MIGGVHHQLVERANCLVESAAVSHPLTVVETLAGATPDRGRSLPAEAAVGL